MGAKEDLEEKGYSGDRVIVKCDNPGCGRKAVCKWSRNPARGIDYGRPVIDLPESWKVMFDLGAKNQRVLCDECHPEELSREMWIK
jgi:hypothetical protein